METVLAIVCYPTANSPHKRPVNSQAIPHLRKLYADTLVAATAKLPAHSVYRQGVEATIQHRLKILETVKDDEVSKVEQEIGAGQVEELVESARDELHLIDMMAELKACVSPSGCGVPSPAILVLFRDSFTNVYFRWEPLEEKPPANQWVYFEKSGP